MKNKIKKYIQKLSEAMGIREKFANIAEGTHAGSVSITAAADINSAHLIAAFDDSGCVQPCGAASMPIGVFADECDAGDKAAVYLPGCANSTVLCVCSAPVNAGDALFTDDDGAVTNSPDGARFRVGVALASAAADSLVEVAPYGFGSRASQLADSGVHVWTTSATTDTIDVEGASADDFAIATIAAAGGSETAVSAQVLDGKIKFTLDAAGAAESTKISWILIRKQ